MLYRPEVSGRQHWLQETVGGGGVLVQVQHLGHWRGGAVLGWRGCGAVLGWRRCGAVLGWGRCSAVPQC